MIDRNNPDLQILMSVLCTALTYFCVGLPLAVIPQWVGGSLGFDAAVAGFAISVQYFATIVSRGMVGPMVDTAGPKRAILIGMTCAAVSGLVLLLATRWVAMPGVALAVLFLSRIALGFGESLVGTGAIAWGIGRAGVDKTAKTISWNGIATYGAIAAGAPAGVLLYQMDGMAAVGVALLAVGLAGLALAWPQRAIQVIAAERLPYSAVFARILPYGAALGLGAIGFGAITAFIALYYVSHGWAAAWAAISAFGIAFVVSRLMFVPSIARRGGLNVALAFLTIETVGLFLIWLAGTPILAAIGSGIAGFGFGLVFPALGMVVVDLVPAQSRGSAIGAYSMFTDIALCVTGPVAGVLVAHGGGHAAPFLFGGIASLLGMGIVVALIRKGAGTFRQSPL